MHIIDDIYVERRAVSTRSAMHPMRRSGEERLRGAVSSDSVEMSEYPGLAANTARAAGAGGSTARSGLGGAFMPSSCDQSAGIRDHTGGTAGNGNAAGEVYYVRPNHNLSTDFDGMRSSRSRWEPAGDAGTSGLSSEPDITPHRTLPSGAPLDGRASQRHTTGRYNHGLPLSSVRRVQSSETVQEIAASVAGGPVSVYCLAPSENGAGRHPSHSTSVRQQQLQQEQHNKLSRSVGDGRFQGTLQQQQERFPRVAGMAVSVPCSSGAVAGRGRMGAPTSGREEIGESYMTVTASVRSGQLQQEKYLPCAQGVDLDGVPDHNGSQTISRSAPQLQTLSGAGGHTSAVNSVDHSSVGARRCWHDVASTDSTTTANTGTIGNFEGIGHRQPAQQPHRHLYQVEPTAHDRPRYGQSSAGAGGVDDQSSLTPGMERLNASAGRGLESAGSSARNGPPTHVRHSSATSFAFSAVDARPLANPSNTYSATPLHARSRSDGRYDRERVALTTRACASNMIGPSASHGHLGRRDLPSQCGQGSHSHGQQQHGFGNGGWQGAGVADSGVAGGSGYHGAALASHQEQPLSQTTRPSSQYPSTSTSSCRGFNVTRRPAPHQLDRRYPPNAAGEGTSSASNAFNGGAPVRTMMESPPLAVNEQRCLPGVPVNPAEAFSLSPAEHRAGFAELTPVDPATSAIERNNLPEVMTTHARSGSHVAAAGGQAGCCGSPPVAAAGVLPRPKNPFEWLQRLHQTRNGKEKCPTTPRTSRSSSMSSLASPARLAALVGGAPAPGDGRACGGHQRSESMATTRDILYCAGSCPAPDCAGNGDCLPGATPDMLVYEVKFKRATRTFLLGDMMDHSSTCCGDRVKVEADRGEDLGTVHRRLPLSEYLHALFEEKKAKAAKIAENGGGGGSGGEGGGSEGKKKRSKSKKNEEDGGKNSSKSQQQQKKQEEAQDETCPVKAIKKILRPATVKELKQLEEKIQEEAQILRVCQTKVRNRSLPMKIVDAEYQFDQHKLTLFFEAERRIDFRELVRDLFAVYKTRIWMQQVKDKYAPSSTTADKSNATGCSDDTVGGGVCPAGSHTHTVPSPPAVAAAVVPAHDTDHDSGYGSSGSNGDDGSGIRHRRCDVAVADAGGGSANFDSRVGGGVVVCHGRNGSGASESSSNVSANSSAYFVSLPAGTGDVAAGGGGAGSTTAFAPMDLPGFNF